MVPQEFWSHPAVVANARKRGKRPSQVLLDSSIHHSMFKDPYEKSRRGRPDIVHQFLLLGLDSLLNMDGGLRLWVHTRNDELIDVAPDTRLPKNYSRYQGLFEELLVSKAVPSSSRPLLRVHSGFDVRRAIERIRGDGDLGIVLMHDSGERRELTSFFSETISMAPNRDILCVIGGFSIGDFASEIPHDAKLSVHPDQLKVWTVEMEVLSAFRWALRGTRASEGP